jgi:phosphonatase-like hydrolase
MSSLSKDLRLVIFDMAGTTVDDEINGTPLVLKSYNDAFRKHGVNVPMDVLNEQRGRDKRTVIEKFGGEKADAIYSFFTGVLLENISNVREIVGASETFSFLKRHGVSVALNTGFPKDVAKGIIDHLSWQQSGLIDAWICSEMVRKSRPDPAMIQSLMHHFHVDDPSSVIKIDDTANGIEEGLNAGVITLGVLTGTQSRDRLLNAGALDILESVRELPSYLKEKNYI